MAIRTLTQLKEWFKRGAYPTAENFADWMDSFWHKTDDKIPISAVEELATQLNSKYNNSSAEELERKTNGVISNLADHKETVNADFIGVNENIAGLVAEDVNVNAAIVAANKDIDTLQASDVLIKKNITTLQGVDADLQTSLNSANVDIDKIQNLIKDGATLDVAKAALLALGAGYKDVHSIGSTLKTFLTAADTSASTIDTWKEIEAFLGGVTDTQSLTQLLATLKSDITVAQAKLLANKSDKTHSHAWGAVTGKPTTFPASTHSHTASQITEQENKRFMTDSERVKLAEIDPSASIIKMLPAATNVDTVLTPGIYGCDGYFTGATCGTYKVYYFALLTVSRNGSEFRQTIIGCPTAGNSNETHYELTRCGAITSISTTPWKLLSHTGVL